ncbi:MAG: CPBP family intramembrane metalloprotease [Candidatus Muirbacterium halophilum]|nr:CPBP family intramembrane metalloprotease [Candidatus Muirbacterium halophilum]MCK9477356.1 CPBP family intramembrane metalloprotease [Candidatus Muirbacterium halophilum]
MKKEFFIKKISLKNTIMSLTFGLSMAITFIFLSELDFQKIKGDNLSVMIYYVLVSSVIGPFVEEIFARGVLYNYLTRKTNIVISILLINIWFVIAHMHLKNENTILFFISIFIAGTIFNLQRYFYKSLTPSIITHFSYNFITGIYTIILVIK